MSSQEAHPFVPEAPELGVVASLRAMPGGQVRLTFDDVQLQPALDTVAWRHVSLYTHTDFDAKALLNLALSQEELALIGQNLLIRLVAQAEFRGDVSPGST